MPPSQLGKRGLRSKPRGFYPHLGFLSFSCSTLSLLGVCRTG